MELHSEINKLKVNTIKLQNQAQEHINTIKSFNNKITELEDVNNKYKQEIHMYTLKYSQYDDDVQGYILYKNEMTVKYNDLNDMVYIY